MVANHPQSAFPTRSAASSARETLEPTSAPLRTLDEVAGHWSAHFCDGAGLQPGRQANGSTIFALRGTVSALRQWFTDAGTVEAQRLNDDGKPFGPEREHREPGAYARVSWTPPW